MLDLNNHALPVGYKLLDYELERVLSGGGFSYVYLARNSKGEHVAIKEYLPSALALRSEGDKVKASSEETMISFRHGLKCFFEEGRALAKIDHKNIVRVTNFFRANDTVYMVMDYEHGRSLQELIQSRKEPLVEPLMSRIFGELFNGLREVHTQKLLHLDIKPANLYIRRDGSPVLLDFGSSRQTLTNTQPTLPPSYTPGYAPPEQYYDRDKLGPWSDIYSVGATMYACLVRTSPLAADARIRKDTLVPAIKIGQGIYSEKLLKIIDHCMELDYHKRPQSVFSLQKTLLEDIAEPNEQETIISSISKQFKRFKNTKS